MITIARKEAIGTAVGGAEVGVGGTTVGGAAVVATVGTAVGGIAAAQAATIRPAVARVPSTLNKLCVG